MIFCYVCIYTVYFDLTLNSINSSRKRYEHVAIFWGQEKLEGQKTSFGELLMLPCMS